MPHGRRLKRLSAEFCGELLNNSSAAAEARNEPTEDGPLAGIRVVEVTTAVQGPAAGQYLRDMGAEVIKVEGPIGDGNRHGLGVQNSLPRIGMGTQFVSVNMGKRSLSLDLKHPESIEVVLRLLETADIFLGNFTQRALDVLGLSYKAVQARNAKIIYACSGQRFRPSGPTVD